MPNEASIRTEESVGLKINDENPENQGNRRIGKVSPALNIKYSRIDRAPGQIDRSK